MAAIILLPLSVHLKRIALSTDMRDIWRSVVSLTSHSEFLFGHGSGFQYNSNKIMPPPKLCQNVGTPQSPHQAAMHWAILSMTVLIRIMINNEEECLDHTGCPKITQLYSWLFIII